jgi:hypothetical protein
MSDHVLSVYSEARIYLRIMGRYNHLSGRFIFDGDYQTRSIRRPTAVCSYF